MDTVIKKLPKGLVELSVALDTDELRPYLEAAAKALTEVKPIQGFRPGAAPYAIVVQHLGEGRIYETAAEAAIRASYARAARENDIRAVGEPEIAVVTLAPGNPLRYTATVPVLPTVQKLAEYRSVKIERKPVTIGEADVGRALSELQKMQTREVAVDRASRGDDKIVVTVAMSRDQVPIEGGVARHHQVYLKEPYYIPGFTSEVLGLKKGDEKNFSLVFPENHYQKSIAGKTVDFAVTVEDVFELTPPALDDQFAATLGQKTLADLKALIEKNLRIEAEEKEKQREEISILEKIVVDSAFDDVPEVMLNAECERMLREVESDIVGRGLVFDDYLASIKKSRGEVKLGFAAGAVRRIKTALAIREIARLEAVEPTDAEVAAAVAEAMNHYADNAAAQAEIKTEDFANGTRATIRNRKTIELLRTLAAKNP